MPQRVVYVTTSRLPTEKAYGVQIVEMCHALSKVHADVTLVHPFRRQPPGRAAEEDLFTFYEVPRSFRLTTIPGEDYQGYLDRLPGRVSGLLFVLRWLYWARRLPALLGLGADDLCVTRDITVSHSFSAQGVSHILELHAMPRGLQRLLLRSIIRRGCRPDGLRGIVALTKHLGRELEILGVPRERILVEHDAVNLKRFFSPSLDHDPSSVATAPPRGGAVVGYVGRFRVGDTEKGLPDLFRAFRILLDSVPDAELLCVGGPDDLISHYQRVAADLNIPQGAVHLVGHRPLAEVSAWIRKCAVVTIPWSFTEFSAHYTSPMKLFEYLAAGVPIVASRLPSLLEVLSEEEAFFFPPGDTEEFAKMLRRALSLSDVERGAISSNSRRIVAERTWDQRATRILSWATV